MTTEGGEESRVKTNRKYFKFPPITRHLFTLPRIMTKHQTFPVRRHANSKLRWFEAFISNKKQSRLSPFLREILTFIITVGSVWTEFAEFLSSVLPPIPEWQILSYPTLIMRISYWYLRLETYARHLLHSHLHRANTGLPTNPTRNIRSLPWPSLYSLYCHVSHVSARPLFHV